MKLIDLTNRTNNTNKCTKVIYAGNNSLLIILNLKHEMTEF